VSLLRPFHFHYDLIPLKEAGWQALLPLQLLKLNILAGHSTHISRLLFQKALLQQLKKQLERRVRIKLPKLKIETSFFTPTLRGESFENR
jgi:hypothetical protein